MPNGQDPFRTSPSDEPEAEPAAPPHEEVVIYGLAAAVGALPVTGALVHHTGFGNEATIGLVIAGLGLIGLAATARAAWRARRSR